MDVKTLLEQLEHSAETLMKMASDYEEKGRDSEEPLDVKMFYDDLSGRTRRIAEEYYIAIRIIKERAT